MKKPRACARGFSNFRRLGVAELGEHFLGSGAVALPGRRMTILRIGQQTVVEQWHLAVPAAHHRVILDDLVVAGDHLQSDFHELLGATVDVPTHGILRQDGFFDEGEDAHTGNERTAITPSHQPVITGILCGDQSQHAVLFHLEQFEHRFILLVNARYRLSSLYHYKPIPVKI